MLYSNKTAPRNHVRHLLKPSKTLKCDRQMDEQTEDEEIITIGQTMYASNKGKHYSNQRNKRCICWCA